MHVVMLSDSVPPDSAGGAGRVAWKLSHGLRAVGHRVTVIAATRGPSRFEERQGLGVHLVHSSYPVRWQAWLGLLNPQTLAPVSRLLSSLRPDVVHAHNVHRDLGYQSLVLARRRGAATVFTAHDLMSVAYTKLTACFDPARPDQMDGWDYRLPRGFNLRQMRARWNPTRNLAIRRILSSCVDARVAVSHELKRALESNHLPAFDVVHNGVDPADFKLVQEDVDALRARLRVGARPVVLIGGRLNREKGDMHLAAALRAAKVKVPDVVLLVLSQSPGPARRMIERFQDLADHVIYGGWLEGAELAAAYHVAAVVATPSICFDAFPTMNLEAMAAGTPPVTTCFGGGREAVIDDVTGFVVNPFDTERLAGRLIQLLTDQSLRCRMATAGRRHIVDRFTIGHQVEAMVALYESRKSARGGS